MNVFLMALHLLPHLPDVAGMDWLSKFWHLRRENDLDLLKKAYGVTQLPMLEASLHGSADDLTLQHIQGCQNELQELYRKFSPEAERPYAQRGCEKCVAPCQYGHLVTLALVPHAATFQQALPWSEGDPMLIARLCQQLLDACLGGPLFTLRPEHLADFTYCVMVHVGGRTMLPSERQVLYGLQNQLDALRSVQQGVQP